MTGHAAGPVPGQLSEQLSQATGTSIRHMTTQGHMRAYTLFWRITSHLNTIGIAISLTVTLIVTASMKLFSASVCRCVHEIDEF